MPGEVTEAAPNPSRLELGAGTSCPRDPGPAGSQRVSGRWLGERGGGQIEQSPEEELEGRAETLATGPYTQATESGLRPRRQWGAMESFQPGNGPARFRRHSY